MNRSRGNIAVEFVLVMPFLAVICAAFFLFARFLVAEEMVYYAGLAAGRYAKVFQPRGGGELMATGEANRFLRGAVAEIPEENLVKVFYQLGPMTLKTSRRFEPAPFFRCRILGGAEDNPLHNGLNGEGSWNDVPEVKCAR